jgi:rod shape determining protein RodA
MPSGDRADYLMAGALAALLCLGLMSVYSATSGGDLFYRQLAVVAAGVLVMVLAYNFPLRALEELSPFFYPPVVALLVLTILFGRGPAGRWLVVGPMNIQASEFAKLVIILVSARWMPGMKTGAVRWSTPLFLAGVLLLVLLTAVQPDLGTGAAMGMIVLGMLYWAGFGFRWIFLFISPLLAAMSSIGLGWWLLFTVVMCAVLYRDRAPAWKWVFVTVMNTAVAALTPVAWNLLMPYQKARLTTFLNPAADPQGAGWNVIQSQVAVGAGRFYGQGFLRGTQKMLAYLPARHTDFIFSVYAEEFGFLGSMLLLGLFLLLIWRILLAARRSMNPYNSILVAGVAIYFLIHVFVNIGMAVGIMPVTGLPLPLMTYGGSHVVTEMLMVGLAMNAARNWRSW